MNIFINSKIEKKLLSIANYNDKFLSSRIVGSLFLFPLILLLLLPFIENNVFAETYVSGIISKDTTWTLAGSPYIVTGDIYVNSSTSEPTLTIEPGVTVKFNGNYFLQIGHPYYKGRLNAKGTALNPIIFTSNKATPVSGDWRGVEFHNRPSVESVLDYVIVEYAGSNGGLFLSNSSPSINNSILRNNKYSGIYITGNSSPVIKNSTISNNGTSGVYSSGTGNVTISDSVISNNVTNGIYVQDNLKFFISNTTLSGNGSYAMSIMPYVILSGTGNSVSDNGTNGIELRTGTISVNTIWSYQAMPYIVTGDIYVNSSTSEPTLTIEPGVTVKFNGNYFLQIGHPYYKGRLNAKGTALNPIIFTSNKATPVSGDWRGVEFHNRPSVESVLDYVIVEYAGSNGGLFLSNSSPSINNSILRNNKYSGIYITGNSSPVIKNSTISNNGTSGVYSSGTGNVAISDSIISNNVTNGIYVQDNLKFFISNTTLSGNGSYAMSIMPYVTLSGTGNSASGNGTNGIELRTGTISVNTIWSYQAMPYIVTGDIYVYSTTSESTLTIEPGILIRFNGGCSLKIGSGLYKGRLNAEGTASNPIIFTSNKVSPTPGDWKGIEIEGHASTESILDYVTVEYGGYIYSGISILDSSPNIKNTTIKNSSSIGLYIRGNSSPVITDSIISNNTLDGIIASGTGNSTITHSIISGNGNHGINVADTGNIYISYTSIKNNKKYAISSTTSALKINHCNIINNGNGIYSSQPIDARFNWWGGMASPEALVTSNVSYEPWLGNPYTYPFYIKDLEVTRHIFNPLYDSVTFNFSISHNSQWSFYFKNSSGNIVRTYAGTGDKGTIIWDGKDSSGRLVPNGVYIYELNSKNIDDVSITSTLIGDVYVNNDFPKAEITYPQNNQFINNNSINITGSAKDNNFKDYKMEYGSGSLPATWTLITTSTTEVDNSILASWTPPDHLSGQKYTIKLSVNDNSGNTSIASVTVNLLNIYSIKVSNTSFTPNGDGVKDTTTISASITYPSNWILEIKNSEGTIVRIFNGAGTSISIIWDGKDSIGNIQPDGKYNFTIKATESTSGTVISKDGTQNIIIDTTPPASVNDLSVAEITSSSVLLNWTAVADSGSVGTPAASYDIRFSTEMISDSNWDSATQVSGEPSPAEPGTKESFWVKGLTYQTTYYIALKVKDKEGFTSGLSNILSITTISPPVLKVEPLSISDTVMEKESSTHVLRLSNIGRDTLSYKVSATNTLISSGSTTSSKRSDKTESPEKIETITKHSEDLKINNKISENAEFASNELIVKFKEGIQQNKKEKLHEKHKSKKLKEFKRFNIDHIKLDNSITVEEGMTLYNSEPEVEYAEPNYVYKIDGIPNDPRFSELWGLHNIGQNSGVQDADIDAPEAWDIFRGDSKVVVAVIDTGVDYTHEDLAANMWVNPGEIPGNGKDDDGNGYIDDIYGINAITGSGNPFDDHKHGTHVAGTIGAVGNNGKGVAGVNWNVKIMALKFLNSSGMGYTSEAVECLDYAIMMKDVYGVNLILTSNSWGGGEYSQALYDAIAASGNSGMLFIAAAGNSSSNNDINPQYPSSYALSNIIAVAATDRNDNLSYFSNYGLTSVDLGAPGSSILSTIPNNNYDTFSGTSMATPHVSGVAALLKGYNPLLNISDIKNIIMESVDPIDSLAGKTVTGGRLNADKALNLVCPSWLRFVSNKTGTIPIGSSIEVEILLDASNISIGNYGSDIVINSNDPINPKFKVPVNLTVIANLFPIPPSDLKATATSSSQINLSWTDNSNNETGFYMERKIGSEGTYVQIGSVGANVTNYNDTGLNDGITYYYRVRAYNASGMSKYSNEANAITPLNAPSDLKATATSSSQINLSWTDNSNNETGFYMERKIGSEGTYVQIGSVGANVTNYNDTGLNDGITYYYRVRAYNTSVMSKYSNEANAKPVLFPPVSPSGLTATAVSTNGINLSWTDNSNNEDGFKIERKLLKGKSSYSLIATVGKDITKYTDTGLTPNTGYSYRIFAYNSSGNSSYSNEASAKTLSLVAPLAITHQATDLNGNSATLNATVNANSSATTLYFEWGTKKPYKNKTPIQNIGSGTEDVSVSAKITGLSPNTTYLYRVVATNVVGTTYGDDISFTTPPITVSITSPLYGDTIYRPDIMVTGTITNSTGNETGITVNGKVATVYGNRFVVNHIPLTDTDREPDVITVIAKDAITNKTATTSIMVNAISTDNHITLTSNIESGISPLEAYLKIDGTFNIESSTLNFSGPSQPEILESSADEYRIKITPEGIYYITANVVSSGNIKYQDTIGIIVLNKTQLDNLLRGKWEGMKGKLLNKDVNGALAFIISDSQKMFRYNFELLKDYLPTIVQSMLDMHLDEIENSVAKYHINAIQDNVESSFYIEFIKDRDGIWKIVFF